MKKIHHGDAHQKSSGLATLISDKIGFKIPVATRHKVGHFIMIEESWKRYDSISVHIYNNSTPRYMTNNWQRKEKMSNNHRF